MGVFSPLVSRPQVGRASRLQESWASGKGFRPSVGNGNVFQRHDSFFFSPWPLITVSSPVLDAEVPRYVFPSLVLLSPTGQYFGRGMTGGRGRHDTRPHFFRVVVACEVRRDARGRCWGRGCLAVLAHPSPRVWCIPSSLSSILCFSPQSPHCINSLVWQQRLFIDQRLV